MAKAQNLSQEENSQPGPIGRTRWAIAEGYIPEESTGPEPEMLSHETACVLNANDREAHVRITIYFSDREPISVPAYGSCGLYVKAQLSIGMG